MDSIRVVVCGDEGVGKSSLIASLVKEKFVPNIQHVIPELVVPRDFSNSSHSPNFTILIDTTPSDMFSLQYEVRKADVIWLVYSDHYTYERISLYWIPTFRSMGVNLPIVLCNNQIDLDKTVEPETVLTEEFIPLLREFKEIEACIRCSAKENYNVNQAFYTCQRAVTHPITPLYDYKESNLKPLAIRALKRIFYLCDRDQDGFLSDEELVQLQEKCFHKTMDINELFLIKSTLETSIPGSASDKGVNEEGFLALNKLYAETGRHETIWGILRTFHYMDSLSIEDKVLYPKMDVWPNSSVELSPKGYQFLVDLFLLFDKDNDGGLNEEELSRLFYPSPGIPQSWKESNFPRSVVCNEQGDVTLQGWLAQWAMTTFLDCKTVLEYLGYFGYGDRLDGNNRTEEPTTSALRVTRQRKTRRNKNKTYRSTVADRTVFNCLILGPPGCGKTSLLESFLGRQYSPAYSPTIQPKIAVNNVELKGGKQCYLIVQELGELEGAVIENSSKLDSCDVLCLAYDSSDPESFQYLIDLRAKYPDLDKLPCVYVALKADLDRQQQRADQMPEPYTRSLNLPPPLHISSSWASSLSELLSQLVEAAANPKIATPCLDPESESEVLMSPFAIGCGAMGFMMIMSVWYLKGYFLARR
ncbi:DEKNAAC104673 [Brettanomyces naardenensis]|uniref:Mitochondrial Rho GTPase n=1 Tax=Brettanomyces naardenensis TaxID=13370 RepID=A0A448YRH8_BRENA|nr:DEKNAAC104673 [Brettanomyces naardenensis]